MIGSDLGQASHIVGFLGARKHVGSVSVVILRTLLGRYMLPIIGRNLNMVRLRAQKPEVRCYQGSAIRDAYVGG